MKRKRKVTFQLVILCLVIGLLAFFPNRKIEKYLDMKKYTKSTVHYKNGKTKEIAGLVFGKVDIGDVVDIDIKLEKSKTIKNSVLCFDANYAACDVKFGDKILDSYGKDYINENKGVFRHNYMIDIPQEAWGENIRITLYPSSNNVTEKINRVWIYPSTKAGYYYYDAEFYRPGMDSAIFVISMMLIIILLLINKKTVMFKRLACVAAFGVLCSLWIAISGGFQQVFGFNSYYITTLEYILLLAQGIPFLCLFRLEENSKKWDKILKNMIYIAIFVIVIESILNYTNIMHFSSTLIISHVVIIVYGIIIFIHAYKNYDKALMSKKMELLGMAAIVFSSFIDILNYYFENIGFLVEAEKMQSIFPIGLGLFLMFFIARVVYINSEQQDLVAKKQMQLFENQIRPHFLCNSLASIREIIYVNPNYAYKKIGDLAVYLRGSVRALSDVELINFAEEMRFVKAYVEIEKVRFGDQVIVEYDIDNDNFFVPPLSIQPFFENAIRHGIAPKEEGKIYFICKEYIKYFLIEIKDTGVGFDLKETLEKESKDSVGMKNSIYRLKNVLNAKVDIESVVGEGTKIVINIPKNGGLENFESNNSR